jgi:hypothetical protein
MSNFLPVYVQTTTCVLGYLNGEQQYDAQTAAGYIANFATSLDPAAVSLAGATNLAEVNGMMQAFSFSYIDAQAEVACGIAPGANFLDVAVAGNGLTGNVPFFRLRAAFNNLLPRRVPNGRYLFAVIDHNAAHHFSIPFAEYAFTTANSVGQHRQRVIVILDQHSDIGSVQPAPPPIARCENWGGLALKTVGAAPAPPTIVADRYLHTGWATKTIQPPVNVAQQYMETNQTAGGYKMVQVVIPPGLPQNLSAAVVAGLAGQAVNVNNTDVYITWDRDSVQGSMTPWGDGMYVSASLGQAISTLATDLTNSGAHVVGVDVVGLPSQGGYSRAFSNLPNANATALTRANTDTVALLTAVRTLAP